MNQGPFVTPLPSSVYASLPPSTPEVDIKTFLETRVAECDRGEIKDEFKRTLVLEAQRSRRVKARKPRVSQKALTAREKRDLGLSRLPKVGLQYTQFQGLHDLWLEYMVGLLDIEAIKKSGWEPGNLEEPKLQQLQMKICRADLHGALVQVDRADCPTQVGRKGICLMETKHTLQIISIDNKLRMIPKRGTTFSMEVSGFRFSFPGSSFLSRPGDRATKKPKNKMPLDF